MPSLATNQFSKNVRLLTKFDFETVFKANKKLKVSDRYFVVLAKQNGLSHPRIGFAVAKKKVRLANRRNNIKRVVREQFRLNQHDRYAYDLIVLANPASAEADKIQLSKSFNHLWIRLQNLHKKHLST